MGVILYCLHYNGVNPDLGMGRLVKVVVMELRFFSSSLRPRVSGSKYVHYLPRRWVVTNVRTYMPLLKCTPPIDLLTSTKCRSLVLLVVSCSCTYNRKFSQISWFA